MKVVLVTGGSRGIGAATVKKFAEEKYTVILNYNSSADEAKALQNELNALRYDVHLMRANVSNAVEVAEMFLQIKKYFKHLDVLINNAGIALNKLCQDVTLDEYDKVMNINAKGAFLVSQQAIKMFVSQGRGAIVNVSSIWGVEGASCESVYAMSKHAIVGLTKSLAEELAPSNVTVNCVCPPIVQTDMSRGFTKEDISEFCRQHNVRLYSAEMVAQDIFRLATSDKNGIILCER